MSANSLLNHGQNSPHKSKKLSGSYCGMVSWTSVYIFDILPPVTRFASNIAYNKCSRKHPIWEVFAFEAMKKRSFIVTVSYCGVHSWNRTFEFIDKDIHFGIKWFDEAFPFFLWIFDALLHRVILERCGMVVLVLKGMHPAIFSNDSATKPTLECNYMFWTDNRAIAKSSTLSSPIISDVIYGRAFTAIWKYRVTINQYVYHLAQEFIFKL